MNLSIAEIAQSFASSKIVREAVMREHIAAHGNYQEFTNVLYKDLDTLIYDLQAGRELLQDDSEDRLTAELMRQLRRLGYSAKHDSKTGGHVDLAVELGGFSWIGEAKKDGNFKEGFLQLTTRYVPASGNYSHNAGGLLFYLIETPDALAKIEAWMAEIKREANCDKCSSNMLAFYSDHKLEGSGTLFRVRTMGISLYHKPKDKAAIAKAARHAAKAVKTQAAGPTSP